MPDSPRTPPRPSIDDATLQAALAGEPVAVTEVTTTVGLVLATVFAERLRHVPDADRHELELDAWRFLTEDGMNALGQWSSSLPIPFAQYVAETACAWLDGTAELAARSRSPRPVEWTPAMVAAALDGRRARDGRNALSRELGAYLLIQLRHVARLTLRSWGSPCDVMTEADDMAHDYAAMLLHHDGAILRRWDPARGRSTLRSYLSFIAQRDFWQRLKRAKKRTDGITRLHEPPGVTGDELSKGLLREQRFQAIAAQLDADERRLLGLMLHARSAEDGAEALGINANAYYQRKRRLKQKIDAIGSALDLDR